MDFDFLDTVTLIFIVIRHLIYVHIDSKYRHEAIIGILENPMISVILNYIKLFFLQINLVEKFFLSFR